MYVGIDSCHCGDGALIGMQHFGDRHLDSDGSVKTVEIPHSLYVGCRANNIEVLIDIPFGESHGGEPFPFHTKARKMLKRLVSEERLNSFRLNRPLPSTINFSVSPNVQQWVDARLRNGLGLDATKHLCVITRSGYTSVYKNWGHRWREEMPLGKRFEGEECRDFVKLLKAKNERWRILVMEDRLFDGNDSVSDFSIGCLSYAQLFDGDLGGPLPFAWILKAVLKRAELVVGVPSGPTHLALAMPHLPVVGIWFTAIPQADKKMGWLGVVTQPLSWG